MKPITNLSFSVGLTAAFLLMCGFLASKLPVSMASESVDSMAGLVVDIANVRNDDGTVIVFVFDNRSAFEEYDYENATAYAEIAAETSNLQAHFPELAAGTYAVSLFHDENDDDDFNMDGMNPVEGYGTSGAENRYDEPTFDDASTDSGRVSVLMHYPQ